MSEAFYTPAPKPINQELVLLYALIEATMAARNLHKDANDDFREGWVCALSTLGEYLQNGARKEQW